VRSVSKRGWSGIKNGELLTLARHEFDAFLTVDRMLAAQQDLGKYKIAVVLLRARTNRLEHIQFLAAELLERFPHAIAGELTIIGS